jgi:hypothetical protein
MNKENKENKEERTMEKNEQTTICVANEARTILSVRPPSRTGYLSCEPNSYEPPSPPYRMYSYDMCNWTWESDFIVFH